MRVEERTVVAHLSSWMHQSRRMKIKDWEISILECLELISPFVQCIITVTAGIVALYILWDCLQYNTSIKEISSIV